MDRFINIYKDVLTNKYAQFTGRAGRQEFWSFVLVNIIVGIVLGIIDNILNTSILGSLYNLAVLIPSLALGARRLHDLNKSGWWQLLGLIPIIGWLILIIWAATPGEAAANQYGPAPKAPAKTETPTASAPQTPAQ